mgnify:CR=1 FL=1
MIDRRKLQTRIRKRLDRKAELPEVDTDELIKIVKIGRASCRERV